jgi:hypothetical protein
MRFVIIGCLCAGAMSVAGLANGRAVPSGSGATATAAALGWAAAMPATVGAGPHGVLLLTKTCDAFDHCTVITSSSGPIPAGSDVNYFGPLLDARTTSSIRVTTPGGDTADGHCSLSYKSFEGTCVITAGTGELEGLHANMRVSSDFESDPNGVFTWEGRYHYAP